MLEQLLPNVFWPEIWQASIDTLNMLLGSMLFTVLLGLPLGVLLFLTDGDITSMSAQQVAELNDRGLRTVINTIAFGDDTSQDLLVQIAQDSGGVYRFVDTTRGGRP